MRKSTERLLEFEPAGPLSTSGDDLTFLHELLTVQEVVRQFESISLPPVCLRFSGFSRDS
jgi:hypothetical protein